MSSNVGEDEMPPQSIWHSPKKCYQWVKDRRKERYDGKGSSGGFLEFKDTEVETKK